MQTKSNYKICWHTLIDVNKFYNVKLLCWLDSSNFGFEFGEFELECLVRTKKEKQNELCHRKINAAPKSLHCLKSVWALGWCDFSAICFLLPLLAIIIIFRFFSVKLNAHKLQPFVNCSANKHFRGLSFCFIFLNSAVRISQSKCVCKFF